ncbi:MAG: NADP-dependent oxidoreductase [Alphaproteobacteria bacterium]|nr:NADP-dependent oxidoreductase [Alphaproteobacteria bacterium]
MKRQIVTLANYPKSAPQPSDFTVSEAPLPGPADGEVQVEVLALSLDPYMASAIKGRHMSGAIAVGDVMPGEAIARVTATRRPDMSEGAIVSCRPGWVSHANLPLARAADGMAAALDPGVRPLVLDHGVPVTSYLGVLGMPGLTAWSALETVLRPRTDETIAISAATGAVGGTAVQLARRADARVIAVTSGAEKCAAARDIFGAHAVVDRNHPEWRAMLEAASPNGIDAFFDVAGGPLLDAVLDRITRNGRVALCGMMQQYKSEAPLPGPNLARVLTQRARIQGHVVYDHWGRMAEWRALVGPLVASGALRFVESVHHGLDQAPEAFCALMAGRNFGKTVILPQHNQDSA